MFDKEKYKQTALKILSPIKSAGSTTRASDKFLFTAQRSNAGRDLPEYYLIYFLFADLLGFKNLGQFEKIAWSFPIDYNGKAFLIDYRKFGVGIFVQDPVADEKDAEAISKKIVGAIKSIRPFYDFIAEEAVKSSQFNVNNHNYQLQKRFDYLLKLYKAEYKKAIKNKKKVKTKSTITSIGTMTSFSTIDGKYYQNANWIAISCIEAFFSWTEHLFIHLAIVGQNLSDGNQVAKLIGGEWKDKFKAAIPYTTEDTQKFYNDLLLVRKQLRNFVAHGAFGKDGNAFKFHSKTGAVPVLMHHKKTKNRFSLYGELTFNESDVIKLIEDFIKYLWTGKLEPAMFYTQECCLPTILPYAYDGVYQNAVKNMRSMKEFCKYLTRQFDDAANMDW